MRRSVSKLIVQLVVLVAPSCAAADGDLVPATPTEGTRSLQGLVEFPPVQGDVMVIVRCDGLLWEDGLLYQNYCFMPDNSLLEFERAVDRAVRKAEFNPARQNGRKISVYFQYSVVFERRGSLPRIRVFPYHVYGSQDMGSLDTGPQRYKSSRQWAGCHVHVLVWLSMKIDERGVPHDVSIIGDRDHGRCGTKMVKLAGSGRFIPAMRDGKPVSANYYELFWSEDMGRPRPSSTADD